jgi:hypothetical protein
MSFFQEEVPMQFEEYNGWPNFPTWDVYTVMTSYYETQAAWIALEEGLFIVLHPNGLLFE